MSCVKVASMAFNLPPGQLTPGQMQMSYTVRSPWASASPKPKPTSPHKPTPTTTPTPSPPSTSVTSTSTSTTTTSRPSISTTVVPTGYGRSPPPPPPPPPGRPLRSAHGPSRAGPGASEIIPRLFISDLSFAENPACLTAYRITHIVSALSSSVVLPPSSALHPHPAPRHLHVRVEDFPFAELAAHLPGTIAWMREAFEGSPEARVLVHCGEGVSRSVSVVAAYLIREYGWTPQEAVRFIKTKRRTADPNSGFVQQLGEYARSLRE